MLNRRSFLVASLVCAPAVLRAESVTVYVSAAGTGRGDGSAPDHAAAFGGGRMRQALETMARTGGDVVFDASSRYVAPGKPIRIGRRGGGGPLRFVGRNFATGADGAVRIAGDRTVWATDSAARTDTRSWNAGETLFALDDKAADVQFQGFQLTNVGTFVALGGSGCDRLVVDDVEFRNVRRLVESRKGRTSTDVLVSRIRGRGFSKALVSAGGECSGWRIVNPGPAYELDAGRQENDDRGWSRAVSWGEMAHHQLCQGLSVRNCVQPAEKYWQGDGFEDNDDNHDNVWIECEARNCGDGGFDCKGRRDRFIRCVSEQNKNNFRLWGDGQSLEDCTSRFPAPAEGDEARASHFQINGPKDGGSTAIRIDRPVIEDGADGAATVFLMKRHAPSAEVTGGRWMLGSTVMDGRAAAAALGGRFIFDKEAQQASVRIG